jgi:amidase
MDVPLDEVLEVARQLGLELTPDEAPAFRERIEARLQALERFVSEPAPSVTAPARDPGYRPTAADDPLHAWMWRCEIRRADAGLLAGKTVSFKDHIAVAGIPLSLGAESLVDFVPDEDATIVTRVLAAGGTITGKNSLDGLSGGAGYPRRDGPFPRPLNPHDHDRATAGSSSGSAVAVAAGQVDISFGGDQGGSIRIPAAWCGCIGLKPSFGLVSHFGAGFAADSSLDHVGPLARTHEDVARALQAVAGLDPLDPRGFPDVPPSIDVLTELTGGVDGVSIGILEEGFAGAESDVAAAVLSACDVLEAAGAKLRRISVSAHDQAAAPFETLMLEGAVRRGQAGAINELWSSRPSELSEGGKLLLLIGTFSRRRLHGRAYTRANDLRPWFRRQYDEALAEVDLLVLPTMPGTAPVYSPPADELADRLQEGTRPEHWYARNTCQFNYTGHPALAVPCGKVDGLPVSMQLVGPRFGEPLLLRAGYAFEHSVEWDALISPGRS